MADNPEEHSSSERGTDGYRIENDPEESGTDGYRAEKKGDGAGLTKPSGATRGPMTFDEVVNPPPDDGRPLWQRLGFGSNEEWWEAYLELDKGLTSQMGMRPRRVPATTRRPNEYRQVGVKLSTEDHERLRRAAKEYRMPPATLVRLILVRALEVFEAGRP